MAAPNLSEIATTAIKNYSATLADNVSNNNALLMRLNSRGNIRTVDGGETILENIEYQDNSTYKRYQGYEVLNISPSEVFTSAEFGWKQAAVSVTMSGAEMAKNSGKSRQHDLLRGRMKNADHSMKNGIDEDMWSTGTADSAKQITGVQAAVPETNNTGTYGGINRATWSFWRNYSNNAGGSIATDGNVSAAMNKAWVNLCRGMDKTDLIVMDNDAYVAFLGTLQDHQRFTATSSDLAKRGFDTVKFMTADVLLGDGVGGNQPTRTAYFLNTRYLHWRPHRQRNMVPLGEAERHATNQDAFVRLIGWMGNLTCSNARLQGRVEWSA